MGAIRAQFVSGGRDRPPGGALQYLAIIVPLLLSGCLPGDVATDGSSTLTPPSASTADEIMQLRPVEAIGQDLPLSCGADEPCAPEVLLAVHGITLEGPHELHFSLGDLLITGGDVAQATVIEVPMGDESEQSDYWRSP
jgi:hypothetical protein